MLVRQPIDDTPASITVFSNWMKAATLGSLPGAGAAAGSRDGASRVLGPFSGDLRHQVPARESTGIASVQNTYAHLMFPV